jgi:hypothetical protein
VKKKKKIKKVNKLRAELRAVDFREPSAPKSFSQVGKAEGFLGTRDQKGRAR